MSKTRICEQCGASLPEGVAGVFCPACALRVALAVQNAAAAETLLPKESRQASSFSWLSPFKTVNRLWTGPQKPLALAASTGGDFPPVHTSAPEPGDVIEDYEILKKIGGNMGLVFKARHRLLDSIVAIKFFPADAITDPARLTRFQRELRAMGQLKHPNLVTAADARVVGCWHLVAMEFIEGMDLQALVQTKGRLPIAEACEVARQAALGLQCAHQHGLIHRDIKPSNLMLTIGGTIKVIDLGLALRKEETQLTQDGAVLGTMSYCAPEQVQDASEVDIRADIYALGCTLYHLLAGKPPYSQRKTFTEIIKAHIHEPFPSLTEARPDAPAGLEAVLKRMVAKDPVARFATPHEVAEALEPFARDADLKPFVPPRVDHSPLVRSTPGPSRTPPAPGGPQPSTIGEQRPTRGLILAALLVLLLAIVAGVFFALNRADRAGATRRYPVVVLMDTTAPKGVYDADNAANGGSNAKELYKVLAQDSFLPPAGLYPEPLSAGWDRESYVLSLRPDLVIIHRSAFFHSYNAVYKFGSTNEFADPTDDPRWLFLYNLIAEDKLISLVGNIASEAPHTQVLVYSRGTDTNWLSAEFRAEWVNKIEVRFKKLKGRVHTMVIPNKYQGTFRDPQTAEELRSNVVHILKLPRKTK